MREEITSSLDEEEEDKEEEKKSETSVGVVHSGGQRATIDVGLGSLGPSFYHWSDNGEYAQWLREYPDYVYDVMVTSHYKYLRDDMDGSRKEEYSLLEPCEVLTEEEWLQGELTPWVDGIEECSVSLVHVDGTQDEKALLEAAKLEEPLHFKTTLTGIVVGQDVKNYPKVPLDGIETRRNKPMCLRRIGSMWM